MTNYSNWADKFGFSLTGQTGVEEAYNSVGASSFNLKHDFFYSVDIWTGAGATGVKLTLNTDFTLVEGTSDLANSLNAKAGIVTTVKTGVTIINATYQTGDLFITPLVSADIVDNDDINLAVLKVDTAANLATLNPTLRLGEMAKESDSGFIKIGNGGTAYNSLPYYSQPTIQYNPSNGSTITLDSRNASAIIDASVTDPVNAVSDGTYEGQTLTFDVTGTGEATYTHIDFPSAGLKQTKEHSLTIKWIDGAWSVPTQETSTISYSGAIVIKKSDGTVFVNDNNAGSITTASGIGAGGLFQQVTPLTIVYPETISNPLVGGARRPIVSLYAGNTSRAWVNPTENRSTTGFDVNATTTVNGGTANVSYEMRGRYV
jgi:hypothetical protein